MLGPVARRIAWPVALRSARPVVFRCARLAVLRNAIPGPRQRAAPAQQRAEPVGGRCRVADDFPWDGFPSLPVMDPLWAAADGFAFVWRGRCPRLRATAGLRPEDIAIRVRQANWRLASTFPQDRCRRRQALYAR